MGAKGYSAGAIFLQVVPVFGDVQRSMEAHAKGWERTLGDRMEQAGEKAGDRAGKAAGKKMNEELARELETGIKDIEKSLGGVNTRNLSSKLRGEVKAMRSELESLSKADIHVDDNFDKVIAKVAALRTEMDAMRKRSKVFIEMDGMQKVSRDLLALEATIRHMPKAHIEVDVDTRDADRKIGAFEKSMKGHLAKARDSINGTNKDLRRLRDEIEYMSRLRVGIDVGGSQARREIAEIAAELKALSEDHPDVEVRIDAARAVAELVAFEAYVHKIDGENANVDVRADTARGLAKLAIFQAVLSKINGQKATAEVDIKKGRGVDQSANTFRSFNAILFAAVAIGPALVPVLGAIAGGLLAIGPAAAVAGAGIGAAIIGFSGLSGALQALQARQDQQAKTAATAAKQNTAAGNAIADAQRGVADAERNAARAAQDAARRVADAKRSAAEAIRSALEQQKSAQQAYAQSVKDVQQAEADLRQARKDAAGTGHSLKDQIKDNNLAITQAQLDSAAATNAYNAVMADGSSTNTEQIQAKHDRDAALQALHELRDQQKDLAAQKKKWDKQGVNGTDQVQQAQDSLTSAIQAQKDAYKSLQDAARAVDKARADGARSVADAIRAQNQTLADNARAIADAKRGVDRAKQSQDELNQSITSQDQAVQAAFSKLGPAGRKFALFLFGLKQGFYKFRNEIQAAMLPSIQSAIEGFLGSKSGSVVETMLVRMARGFGQFVKALSQSFQGPVWLSFFKTLSRLGPSIQKAYGGAFIKFMEAMASILNTLAPYALQFARGLERMMTSFANWAKSKKGTDGIERFMNAMKRIGPDVLNFIGALARGAVAVAVGLSQWGDVVLRGLTGFLNTLDKMNPKTLSLIVTGIVGLLFASQAAYAVSNLVKALGALFATGPGVFIFAIIGLVVAITYLYKTNKGFRDFIKKAWHEISKVVMDAWNKYLKPALSNLMDAFNDLWHKVLAPFLKWAAPILLWLVKVILKAVIIGFAVMADAIAWAIEHVVIPVIQGLMTVGKWLWTHVFKPVIGFIVGAWHLLGKVFKWVWQHVLHPVFYAIGKIVTVLWKATLKVIFLAITKGWKLMMTAMKWAWEHILRPIWNAIKVAAMWLWNHAGLKQAFGFIKDGWDGLMRGMKWVWEHVLKPVWDFIKQKALPALKNAFQVAVDGIKRIWEGLKKVVAAPIKFILETVINGGLIAGFNKVASWVGVKGFKPIPVPKAIDQAYATGGVLPGYTPGRDVHDFHSPTGGRLRLSGGEAIMRPEWTSAMGRGYIDEMNALAARGGVNAIRKAMGFATGGVLSFAKGGVNPDSKVYINGMAISRVAAAQIALAREISKINISMMQGGFGGNHILASGTSHNYPGVGDFAPGSIRLEKVLRQVGFAAWARNVAGRAQVGSGAHVHAVSLLDPGDKRSPQVYGSWANHGDGLSGYNNDPAPHYPWIPHLAERVAKISGAQISAIAGSGAHHRSIPGFIKDLVLHPLDTVKGFVTSTWKKIPEGIKSPVTNIAKQVPLNLVGGFIHKAYDMLPGWVKGTLGAAKNIAESAIGGIGDGIHMVGNAIGGAVHTVENAVGMKDGGILPYNGTMMYDNGGYLAPGMTTVMNLTGKPEPVFTNEQWDKVRGGHGGGNLHYEPHFEGSDLTAEDVAGDLNFAFRKMRRGGRYTGVGGQ